jgi:hypothetical protein
MPITAMLKERKLNLLNKISKLMRNNPKTKPINTPIRILVCMLPEVLEIIKVVMKNTLRTTKRMRIKATERFMRFS